MSMERGYDPESLNGSAKSGRGGFLALAVISAALGAGTIAQLQRDLRRRRAQSRREKRIVALAGLFIGAGLTALLTPESGTATRRRLGGTLTRIKVGTVDRIERLRQREEPTEESSESRPVRSVQELGRDPNSVF
jgi:hypothetical protein